MLQDIGGSAFRLSGFTLQAGRGRAFTIPERFRRICGADTSVNDGSYGLAFPTRLLGYRPATANPTTAAMCEQACRRLLERRRGPSQVSALVKEYLTVSTSPAIPTLESISRLTNTSTRTLRRQLMRERQTFRALVADGRSELAAELVLDGTQSMSDIAARLGYSSPSCFSQAFKRWHGVSPTLFRRRGGQRTISQLAD